MKIEKRQNQIKKSRQNTLKLTELFKINSFDVERVGSKNCENLIGSVEIPVGVAGPVGAVVFSQSGTDKKTQNLEFVLPLATTEGALVASVNRGCKAINEVGGAKVWVELSGMTRAPVFKLPDGKQARRFVNWLWENSEEIKQICESTSSHLELIGYQTWVRGRQVFVRFSFDTDQAMGMNMVTLALKQAWKQKISLFPNAELVSLSGNMCTDKKSAVVNQLLGRGFQVQAEVFLTGKVLKEVLRTNISELTQAHTSKNLVGTNLAGSFSQNMHAANMVAAMFLATGQDPAHVVGGSQAQTTVESEGESKIESQGGCEDSFEKTSEKNYKNEGVYFAVNLPNLNLGTVGGGTDLPTFKQARQLILNKDAQESLTSQELAAAVGLAVLAGEISGLAALAGHDLARAHQKLARS